MAKVKRRKRFRKESVKYRIIGPEVVLNKKDKKLPVKYLNRVRVGRDAVLLFRILRKPKKRRPSN